MSAAFVAASLVNATRRPSGEKWGMLSFRVEEIATTGDEVVASPGADVSTRQMFVRGAANVNQTSRLTGLAPRDHWHQTILTDERQALRRTALGDPQSPKRPSCRKEYLGAVRHPPWVIGIEFGRCEACGFAGDGEIFPQRKTVQLAGERGPVAAKHQPVAVRRH